jgi:methionyl-tRNA formyltransferase
MGTPELARVALAALVATPAFEVVAAVTQPDRPKGRDLRLLPSPVKEFAVCHDIPVLQPERARDAKFLDSIRQFRPDLITVAAFGQILPQQLLDVPRFGCVNVHTSLLPRYRGAAPIQWAILNDDRETGVTIMRMEAGLDTGDILAQQRTAILEGDDAQTLQDRLAQIGAHLLLQTVADYVAGKIQARPQPAEGVSYARKITKADGLIDWTRPAREIWNQVRGLVPWPGAFTHLPAPHRGLLKIWRAEIVNASALPGEIASADKNGILVGCGHDALRILVLQREGSRRLGPQEFLAGCPLKPGRNLVKMSDRTGRYAPPRPRTSRRIKDRIKNARKT